jgi:hypothetical protein
LLTLDIPRRTHRIVALDAECLCGDEVDDQIEFCPEFDR